MAESSTTAETENNSFFGDTLVVLHLALMSRRGREKVKRTCSRKCDSRSSPRGKVSIYNLYALVRRSTLRKCGLGAKPKRRSGEQLRNKNGQPANAHVASGVQLF